MRKQPIVSDYSLLASHDRRIFCMLPKVYAVFFLK